MCREILNQIPTAEETKELLINPHDAGGLQFLLPGENFEIMQQVIQYEDTSSGFRRYHEARDYNLKEMSEIYKNKLKDKTKIDFAPYGF